MTLASIHCARENEFVVAAFGGAEFWIGANDRSSEGTFVWDDETSFDYQYWNFGEPNNWCKKEHCAVVKANGKWNDVFCNDTPL